MSFRKQILSITFLTIASTRIGLETSGVRCGECEDSAEVSGVVGGELLARHRSRVSPPPNILERRDKNAR